MVKNATRSIGTLSMFLLLFTVGTGANVMRTGSPEDQALHLKVALLTVLISMLSSVLSVMLVSATERQLREMNEELQATRRAAAAAGVELPEPEQS